MQNTVELEEEYSESPEEKYQSLLKSIAWTPGFRLLFVSSSPAKGDEIIERVKKDLPEKDVEVLDLTESIDNLYDLVGEIATKKPVNVLFVRGLEYSLDKHDLALKEQGKFTDDDWRRCPPNILVHLNIRREHFRDSFPICFVFLLRDCDVTYFIRRAPDFFDWNSGLTVFPCE